MDSAIIAPAERRLVASALAAVAVAVPGMVGFSVAFDGGWTTDVLIILAMSPARTGTSDVIMGTGLWVIIVGSSVNEIQQMARRGRKTTGGLRGPLRGGYFIRAQDDHGVGLRHTICSPRHEPSRSLARTKGGAQASRSQGGASLCLARSSLVSVVPRLYSQSRQTAARYRHTGLS